jgi:hypothetical protein
MLSHVLLAIASLVLLCFDFAAYRTELACPPTWMAGRTTADGFTSCRKEVGCVDRVNVRGGWTSDCDGELEVWRRIYCDPGERAAVDLRGIVRCVRLTGDGVIP